MIGKVNYKAFLPDFFGVNVKQVSDNRAVEAEFNHYFIKIGKSVESKLLEGVDFKST